VHTLCPAWIPLCPSVARTTPAKEMHTLPNLHSQVHHQIHYQVHYQVHYQILFHQQVLHQVLLHLSTSTAILLSTSKPKHLVIPVTNLPEALVHTITGEINRLLEDGDFFGQFKQEYQEDYPHIERVDLRLAGQRVESLAPVWFSLLQRLLTNRRGHRQSYSNTETEGAKATMYRRVFTISSIVCYARSRTTSNCFPTLLGLYLQGTGTKRRV
jgi:hypothetical protein